MREWLAVGLIVVAGGPLSAQSQRLGDVADSIRLRTDAVVIDERAVGDSRTRAATGGLDRARTELGACRDLGGQLLSVLRRSLVRDLFFDADWREDVRSASLDLVARVDRLDTVRVADEATDLWLAAIAEAESYLGLVDRMEGLLATDTPDYRPVLDGLEETNAALDRFVGRLAAAERRIDRAAGSAPPTGADVDRIVDARCGIHPRGSTDHTVCVDRQRRAAAELTARSRYSAGVDEGAFNSARNRCAELHPGDLVERDRCERLRMTSSASP